MTTRLEHLADGGLAVLGVTIVVDLVICKHICLTVITGVLTYIGAIVRDTVCRNRADLTVSVHKRRKRRKESSDGSESSLHIRSQYDGRCVCVM